MNNIDTQKLREAVRHYKFYSTPSNSNQNAPCSVADIERVIQNTASLFEQFIKELEK